MNEKNQVSSIKSLDWVDQLSANTKRKNTTAKPQKTLMIRTLLCFLLTSVVLPATAQTLTLKGKTYPATDSWDFICEQYALSGSAQVQIAKTDKGGLLQLSVETANPSKCDFGYRLCFFGRPQHHYLF
jgi:hypothetical protein